MFIFFAATKNSKNNPTLLKVWPPLGVSFEQALISRTSNLFLCVTSQAQKFDIYVHYCKDMQESNAVLVQHGGVPFFEAVQKKYNIEHPISAYLIKPVQRITKYQLLLKELQSCCDEEGKGELKVRVFQSGFKRRGEWSLNSGLC
jgi:hypothetical protein